MNIRYIAALLGTLVIACSAQNLDDTTSGGEGDGTIAGETTATAQTEATSDATKPDAGATTPITPEAADDDDDDDDDDDGDDDTGGGAACCVNGELFECPDVKACLGGFDLQACIAGCGTDAGCFSDCADQARDAKGPVGCTKKTPPANVTCE